MSGLGDRRAVDAHAGFHDQRACLRDGHVGSQRDDGIEALGGHAAIAQPPPAASPIAASISSWLARKATSHSRTSVLPSLNSAIARSNGTLAVSSSLRIASM